MDDKKTARLLRKQGFSYSEINNALSRKRPKSTLSYWFKDLPLSESQKEELRIRFASKLVETREKSLLARKKKRIAYLEGVASRNTGIDCVLDDSFVRKALLGTLYLAEGSKHSGTLTFANSDPRIIRLYLFLLRSCYNVQESKFRCTILARADSPIRELTRFWEKQTAIPIEQFYKARVDKRTVGQPTQKPDYRCVCRVDYLSADIFHEIMSIGNILTSSERLHTGL
jgi:hypothetical protein